LRGRKLTSSENATRYISCLAVAVGLPPNRRLPVGNVRIDHYTPITQYL
jgi:hypothetical protein